MDRIELDSNRDEELSLKQILALLRRLYPEEKSNNGSRSQNNTEAKGIDVSEELKYWRSLYENVETLYRGHDLQGIESKVHI